MKINRAVATLAAAAVVAAGTAALGTGASATGVPSQKPTIVLVHGAFADSSGWSDVVQLLQARGYKVVAAANPLRGLASDSAYVAEVLKGIPGPVVLAGHSYGGEVITNAAAGNPQVKALVYIAAIAPDKGESANDILGKFPGSELPESLNAVPYTRADGSAGTDLYISADRFRRAFAADVPAWKTSVMAATQRPIEASSLGDQSANSTWRSIPSWYLVATQDKAIPPAAQRFMAERAHAHTVEVDAAHAAAVSQPNAVSKIIVDAAGQVK
ncbi:alpha/beta fold hydrolase [Streptomyces sp. NPDC086023]|uniref:alpha/beta fold hydrolase n=1 Tax=Streptomyces sp. NPDC086023 TaxID=3365746 RepID=UPI0037D62072